LPYAHPDDETLGVGGTILKHVANVDNVFWLFECFESQRGFSKKEFKVDKKKN
jgi:hypothetical protein